MKKLLMKLFGFKKAAPMFAGYRPYDVIAAISETVTNCNRLMEGGTK